jgi:hypothetical protein
MALPSSGIITMQDLQTEYGGVNPINLNEYYRNGSYVPNSINVEYPGSFYDYYSASSPQTYWSTGGFNDCVVDDIVVYSGMGSNGFTTSIGGVYGYYTRGSYRGEFPAGTYLYGVNLYRYQTVSVNQNVPTSGAISLSNFYGGRKS